jgi:hypothetical protein
VYINISWGWSTSNYRTIWLVINADKQVRREEAQYLPHLVAALEDLGGTDAAVSLEKVINLQTDSVLQEVGLCRMGVGVKGGGCRLL